MNLLETYDIEKDEFSIVDYSGNVPCARNNHASCVYQDKLYIHGGHDGGKWLDDFYIFDSKTKIWNEIIISSYKPKPRACHTISRIGRKIYLYGGFDGKDSFGNIEIFDIETQIWHLPQVENVFILEDIEIGNQIYERKEIFNSNKDHPFFDNILFNSKRFNHENDFLSDLQFDLKSIPNDANASNFIQKNLLCDETCNFNEKNILPNTKEEPKKEHLKNKNNYLKNNYYSYDNIERYKTNYNPIIKNYDTNLSRETDFVELKNSINEGKSFVNKIYLEEDQTTLNKDSINKCNFNQEKPFNCSVNLSQLNFKNYNNESISIQNFPQNENSLKVKSYIINPNKIKDQILLKDLKYCSTSSSILKEKILKNFFKMNFDSNNEKDNPSIMKNESQNENTFNNFNFKNNRNQNFIKNESKNHLLKTNDQKSIPWISFARTFLLLITIFLIYI